MSPAGLLLSFLNDVVLYCAVIVFVAFVFVWLWQTFFGPIDGNVLKWGKIVVALLCIIAALAWLLGVLGGVSTYHPLGHWR